jgi:hypothetical protein
MRWGSEWATYSTKRGGGREAIPRGDEMSEFARNLDTYGDGDPGPEYIPVVGDRVLVGQLEGEAPAPESERVGTITEVIQRDDGDLRFVVMLDKPMQKHYHWSIEVSLDEIDTVY